MNINLPSISYHQPYDFTKLLKTIEKNILQLRNGSDRKSSSFHDDIIYFHKNWITKENPIPLTTQQLRSVSIHLLESRKSFKELLDVDLLPELLVLMKQEKTLSIQKKIVQLYFEYYFLLQEYQINMSTYITEVVQSYQGHNYLMQIYKKYIDMIIQPRLLLQEFQSFEEIQNRLSISPNSEYYQYLLILDLTKQLQTMEPDDENEGNIFSNIEKYGNFHYDEHLLISEFAVQTLVKKMMYYASEYDYSKWVTFIIELVGDPRTVSTSTAQNVHWDRIGKTYKDFLVGYLSKEDLTLFLEVLSDPEYDDVYRFRKAFWKPFVHHLQYAKLFINQREYIHLDENFKKRFNNRKSNAYSFISDSKRSFIYMDFGTIKVIEGTHNAKVRLYKNTPISLDARNYDYEDFYKKSLAKQSLITEITHSNSQSGTWQNKVFHVLKNYIPYLKVTLKETLL